MEIKHAGNGGSACEMVGENNIWWYKEVREGSEKWIIEKKPKRPEVWGKRINEALVRTLKQVIWFYRIKHRCSCHAWLGQWQYIAFAPEETDVPRKEVTHTYLQAEFPEHKVPCPYSWQVDYTGFLPMNSYGLHMAANWNWHICTYSRLCLSCKKAVKTSEQKILYQFEALRCFF